MKFTAMLRGSESEEHPNRQNLPICLMTLA